LEHEGYAKCGQFDKCGQWVEWDTNFPKVLNFREVVASDVLTFGWGIYCFLLHGQSVIRQDSAIFVYDDRRAFPNLSGRAYHLVIFA
jgi:hypothetical protein